MNFDFERGEILLVSKPYGWTSFDVVNFVRNIVKINLGIKKIRIGHAGTLDPLASGLLILCTGSMTKKINQFQDLDKEYTGTFILGATTPSFDLEKKIDHTYSMEGITKKKVLEVTLQLTGTYDQVPPVFSAKKIEGRRAYKYARAETEIKLKPHCITISAFEITRFELPEVDFRIACSKGTYIRAVARDFGNLLGSGAFLGALCRTRIGLYQLREAWDLEELKKSIQ
jgi:tRNA pseudouridine55 synthase